MKTLVQVLSVSVMGAVLGLAACGKERSAVDDPFADISMALPADSEVVESGEERKVYHKTTAADAAYLKETSPIREERAMMFVNGMGCPQCVTNIDLALEKTGKVDAVRVDLGSGLVYLKFTPGKHPSPAELGQVVSDNGFTLVKIVPKV